MAFRRELLERLGGFDPALGPGSHRALWRRHRGPAASRLIRGMSLSTTRRRSSGTPTQTTTVSWKTGFGATASALPPALPKPRSNARACCSAWLGTCRAGSRSRRRRASQKNRGRQPDFPARSLAESLPGMTDGSIAYLRSRRGSPRGPGPQREPRSLRDLRVLIVTDEYKPVIGGAARSAELLSHHMAGLGHTVAVATAWQPDTRGFEEDGDVRRPPNSRHHQPRPLALGRPATSPCPALPGSRGGGETPTPDRRLRT